MKRSQKLIALAAVGMLALTGCSASAASNEVIVHKGGGPIEAKKAKGCLQPEEKELSKPGDSYFSYPASQSVYDFQGGDGSDAEPITVISSDLQTLAIGGTITFDLNTACDVLQAFHDNIGARRAAYLVPGDNGVLTYSAGWTEVLNTYFNPALNATLDRIAKNYTWKELYSDTSIRLEMNEAAIRELPAEINKLTDGDQEFFQNYNATLLQPRASDGLVASLTEAEESVERARTAEAKAVADAKAAEAAANAQVTQKNAEALVAEAEARAKAATIAPFGSVEAYNNYLAIEKGLNPFQPTYGGGTIVDATP